MFEVTYFWAPWCQPCKTFSPLLTEVTSVPGYGLYIHFTKHNADEVDPEILSRYDIRSLPTVVIEKNGEEVTRFSGAKTRSGLIEIFDRLIDNREENEQPC